MAHFSTFYLSLLVLVSISVALDPPNCPDKGDEICIGHNNNERASGNSAAAILQDAYDQFCGCRYIEHNVHIEIPSSFYDNTPIPDSNFSFLYYTREISGFIYLRRISPISRLSLPNLRIIRGNTRFTVSSNDYSLIVANSDIGTLYLPQLKEITQGGVFLRGLSNTPSLCNVQNVNWTDITSSPDASINIRISGCTNDDYPICSYPGCSSGYCWCNDSSECCQTLTSDCPCDNRCRKIGQTTQCCHSECAAGCTGGNTDQCQACKNVLDDGVCRELCPPRNIYDSNLNMIIPNPDFKFTAGPVCVKNCPSNLFELEDRCVESCPINYRSVTTANGTQRCINCDDGQCPKECTGGSTFTDIDFTGCILITGSLRIGGVGVNDDPAELERLKNIQEIRGSLTIEFFNRQNFSYLSNLKVIGSDPSQVLSFKCNETGDEIKYTVFIEKTDLVSLDLSSLERIENGGIQLVNNPYLCYIGNLSYYIINNSNNSKDICISDDDYRRPEEECVLANLTCHSECSIEQGWCWGPSNRQCDKCKNYDYEGQCVPRCDDFNISGTHFYGANGVCEECHPFCLGACNGEGPAQCRNCSTNLFVKVNKGVGMECLNGSCPVDHYNDSMECLPCFVNCSKTYGCAGPNKILNSINGCFRCDAIVLDRFGEQIYCQRDKINCPGKHYLEQLQDRRGIFLQGTILCHPCHELCSTCDGPDMDSCLSCAFVRGSNSSCAYECDPLTETLNNITKVCVKNTFASTLPIAALGGSVAGVLILILLIISGVGVLGFLFIRNRRFKTIDMQQFGSPEELEMFTLGKETLQPPKMAPNAARLIVAPEDELEFGDVLGSGAFGTVYDGYWNPSGDTNKYHVAIKVLKNASSDANKELLQEGAVMAGMDHDNVVRLYCVCMSKQLMLVSQFVPNGALLDYLKKSKDRLNAYTILLFSSQIAKGMGYLETKHLVHRDLAARNVLVQSPVKVKITDFGLTRIVESDQAHYQASSAKMPVRWLPPESIRNRVFTHKTDVWSFGVTIWEILTFGARPYQDKKPYEILKMLEAGHRLDQPATCTVDLYTLLLECWLLEPESRPTFDDLVVRLSEMLTDPGRYVLTVLDGNANDYNMLPSNVSQEGENPYEQPFTNETLPSGISLAGTFPSTGSSFDPYAAGSSGGSKSPLEKKDVPLGKGMLEYEVPVEGSSPINKTPNPRYISVNMMYETTAQHGLEPPHGYDYIDEKKINLQEGEYNLMSEVTTGDNLLKPIAIEENYETPNNPDRLGSPLPGNVSPYEVPTDGKLPFSQPATEENYEFPENPERLGSPLQNGTEPNYELPESPVHSYEYPLDGQDDVHLLPNAFSNVMYDSRAGVAPAAAQQIDDNYEDPDNQGGFSNLAYDSRAGVLPAPSNQGGFNNLAYDSRASVLQAPSNQGGFNNLAYDSRAGVLQAPSNQGGFNNLAYDSRAGVLQAPSTQGGFNNLAYDSRGGVLLAPSVAGDNNYEYPDVQECFTNLTYDSQVGIAPISSNQVDDNYEDPDVQEGFTNKMYDSHAGIAPISSNRVDDNYEDPDVQEGFTNKMYDSHAGVAPTTSSTGIKYPNNQGFTNKMYDSQAGVAPTTSSTIKKYPNNQGFTNFMYDSRAGVLPTISPPVNNDYEIPDEPVSSPEIRTVSPYEVPVASGDYELPTDGLPRVPQYNVYDAAIDY